MDRKDVEIIMVKKMPTFWYMLLIITLSFSGIFLAACSNKDKQNLNNEEDVDRGNDDIKEEEDAKKGSIKGDEDVVRSIVKEFGEKLQLVSLLAEKKEVEKSMKENYGDLVTEELLKEWMNEPIAAPGRLTSSPWPDHIEISKIKKIKEDTYKVKGEIIEITSEDKNDVAAKRSIALIIKKVDNRWYIDDVTLGSFKNTNEIIYENKEYGFRFRLTKSWKDYTIVTDQWEGLPVGEKESEEAVQSGPIISIRHPKWTKDEERQDIPIMVVTLEQWDSLNKDEFHIGAAPINPSELGRNSKYVFALPARYNYAFKTGYEEVEDILEGKPLEPTESYKK